MVLGGRRAPRPMTDVRAGRRSVCAFLQADRGPGRYRDGLHGGNARSRRSSATRGRAVPILGARGVLASCARGRAPDRGDDVASGEPHAIRRPGVVCAMPPARRAHVRRHGPGGLPSSWTTDDKEARPACPKTLQTAAGRRPRGGGFPLSGRCSRGRPCTPRPRAGRRARRPSRSAGWSPSGCSRGGRPRSGRRPGRCGDR